ncbi:MAG: enoyl-CoA hydratase, partial [Burkholderiaceae bacterium]
MGAQLLAERHGPVLLLQLSNPGARNALHPDMYRSGSAAVQQPGQDATIRAVVNAGHGEHICAGGKRNRLLAHRSKEPANQRASGDQIPAGITASRESPTPVI